MKNTIRTKIIGISSFAAVTVILLAALFLLGCPPPDEEEKQVVTLAGIRGVTAPVTGQTPSTAITPTAQYTGTIFWTGPLTDGKFSPGQTYYATITLTPINNYTLNGVAADFFNVAGATSVSNPANTGVITAIFPSTSVIIVNKPDIPGVTVPIAAGSLGSSTFDAEQYRGNITWKAADGTSPTTTFEAGKVYTATITLTAKTGYVFQGVPANFFKVAGADLVTNDVNSGVVTARFPAALTPVTIPAIQGIVPPETGNTPVTKITDTAQYTGTVTWKDANGSVLSGKFAGGTVYTAVITLTARSGYTFQGLGANYFIVADAIVTYSANSNVVNATFRATVTPITLKAIQGVTPPVVGGTPVSSITPTQQYKGTVTWYSGTDIITGKFESGGTYRAIITLQPEDGYTLTGVAKNFFTVDQATATNDKDSGIVTAAFKELPKTVDSDISTTTGLEIAPVVDATVLRSIATSNNAQYTLSIAWKVTGSTSTFSGTKFAAKTSYTATITLTPKTGYTLLGVGVDYFKVDLATSVTNTAANPGVITAVFPSTGGSGYTRATVDIKKILFDEKKPPVSGAKISEVTTMAETLQYTGDVSWKYYSTETTPAVTDKFSRSNPLIATITLTARDGYTFTGVTTTNYFTVDGADTNKTSNTTVSAIVNPDPDKNPYPDPDKITITVTSFLAFENKVNDNKIDAIVPPAYQDDVYPSTDSNKVTTVFRDMLDENDQYTGTVNWYQNGEFFTGTIFNPGREYKVVITLTAKPGYTFNGVAENFFKPAKTGVDGGVAGAKEVTNPPGTGNTLVVTVVYPLTKFVDISATNNTIKGVVFPKAGDKPSPISANADPTNKQFKAEITWTIASTAQFAAGVVYGAEIKVIPEPGYSYGGLASNFFSIEGTGATASFSATTGIITVKFPSTEKNPNQTIKVTKFPTTGEVFPTASDYFTNVDCDITWNGIWTPTVTRSDRGKFEMDTVYRTTLTLTPKTGFTLFGITATNYFVVDGATTTYNSTNNQVTITFPSTGAGTKVNVSAISDIGIPAITNGANTPSPAHNSSITAGTVGGNKVYTGKIEWKTTSNNQNFTATTFAAKTAYTAVITLTAEPGYTFAGLATDFFTVAGAWQVTTGAATTSNNNPAGTNITVTALFPRTSGTSTTDLATVDIKTIPGVTLPVVGGMPVSSITDTSQYTGVVTWKITGGTTDLNLSTDTFELNKLYTATITLTAKDYFYFTGVTANFFSVAGATSVTNPAGAAATPANKSIVVTANFPAAKAAAP